MTAPILVISHDLVGPAMAGPGIRYYHLARVLAREFPVVLAAPGAVSFSAPQPFTPLAYASGQDPALAAAVHAARAVLVPAIAVAAIPVLRQAPAPLVVDGYNPFQAETFFLQAGEAAEQQASLTQAYLAGDFFLCASERQRDWWLGVLEANGRVNVYTHADDPSLRRLVDLLPSGLPDEAPRATRPAIKGVWPGVAETDRLLLWGGGLWPWLDPLTAIRAMAQVVRRQPAAKLVFPGTRHPNPAMAGIPTHHAAARQLAGDLGLLDRAVFFGDWIPYADWPNALLESDVALTLHYADTLESRLAFRSRVLDYVWAGLPCVATRGDATGELIAAHALGLLVDGEAVDDVARAILQLLETPRASFASRFEAARRALAWQRVARPLIEFCRRPRRAPDRAAMGGRLGNAYYVHEISAHKAQLGIYERMWFVRLVRWLHPYRQRLKAWLAANGRPRSR